MKFFKDYRLLGDDVVIFNTEVATEYRYLMEDVYDISINMSKSVIGDKEHNQIEFTKRLALNGYEMSSIKRNILTGSGPQSVLELVDILLERDFISEADGWYNFIPSLSSEEKELLRFLS
jgi:hypothetical protein